MPLPSPKETVLEELRGQIQRLRLARIDKEREIAAIDGGIEALQMVRDRIENGMIAIPDGKVS